MANVFFGFALADSMFNGFATIRREVLTVDDVRAIIGAGVNSCLNPSHAATIAAMRGRFNLDVEIPTRPPQVSLAVGDSLIVMGVRGLPRLTDRHEYNAEEIASASFSFSRYTVIE